MGEQAYYALLLCLVNRPEYTIVHHIGHQVFPSRARNFTHSIP
jgi:hypothetical protein